MAITNKINEEILYSEIVSKLIVMFPTKWGEAIKVELLKASNNGMQATDFFNGFKAYLKSLLKNNTNIETFPLTMLAMLLQALNQVQKDMNFRNRLIDSIDTMKEADFTPEQIEQLLTLDNYETRIQNNKGTFFASNIEGKIYTGKEAFRKIHFKDGLAPSFPFKCLDLVPEYYSLIEANYIEKQRQIAGSIFNEQAAKERLRLKEIEDTKEKIENNKDKWKHLENKPKFALNTIEIFTHYLQFLNDLPTINSDKAETNEHESEEETNVFCKPMPLNIPIEYFKVFERNSKNGKPYLATEQLNMFIDKAFKGKKNIEKLTFNYGAKEKYFIVKRFFQFYCLAADGFENTTQCKEKYIRLLTDNFTNWDYESARHNFSNKVKRDW